MGKSSGDGGGSTNVLSSFFASLFGLVGSFIGLIFGIFGALASLFSTLPYLLAAVAITLVMVPWVSYNDVVIEEVEHVMRGIVYPFYLSTLRPILDLIRRIYNPLICWWNAINWWAAGVIYEVVYPTIVKCANLKQLFIAAEEFVLALFNDFIVNYFLAYDFFAGPCDFTNITNKWIALWAQWTALYQCGCNDLGLLLSDLPIIPSIAFSAQWADPETWCAISNAVNTIMNMLAILLNLLIQILQAILYLINPQSPFAQVNFTRPNFYPAATLLCQALSCAVNSFENAMNRFWNNYIPISFDWTDFFCWIDCVLCIGVKSANWVLTLVINVDKVVLYPTDPFWFDTMKPLTLEILNLIAPPSQWSPVVAPAPPAPVRFVMTNYFLNTSNSATPTGAPNPVYNKTRLTECLCIAITRAVCYPSVDNTTANCFAYQPGNLLQGYDFCCLTNTLGVIVVDVTSAAVELTYHVAVNGGSDFFIFIDRQPFTGVLVNELANVVACAATAIKLIPTVGAALYNAVVELAVYLLSTLNYLIRTVLGVAVIPYFKLQLPGTPEFITQTNVALDAFVAIQERLIADTPTSLLNSLCILLNSGFGIPPQPCSNCNIGGFIPLARKRDLMRLSDIPELLGSRGRHLHVTPLLWYDNNSSRINFADYGRAFWNPSNMSSNFPWNTRAEVDRFIDNKKRELFDRWNRVLTCKELKQEEAELRVSQPRLYRYRKIRGRYNCDESKFARATPPPMCGTGTPTATAAAAAARDMSYKERTVCTPTPPCFDLCCAFRAIVQTWVQLLIFVARFFNGFVQYQASQQGTAQDFPYFTGEFCQLGKPCLESDLTTLVMLAFEIPDCLCKFLTLVIPPGVIPVDGSGLPPDLCCAINQISDLVVSTLTTIINAINALAQARYDYYTMGFFLDDVNVLLDITDNVVVCLCTFTQAIFPLNYIPAIKAAINFDPCCFVGKIGDEAVQILRLVLNTVISLATVNVNPEAYCYFRLDQDANHQCSGTLEGIGFVKDVFRAVDEFFPTSDVGLGQDSCLLTCGHDQGKGGIAPCICQLFNTLIPWRDNPGLPVSCNPATKNCQNIDLCCPFVKLGIAANLSVKVVIQMLAALWQPWPNGLPEFFINYIFCSEQTSTLVCGQPGANQACAYSINGNVAPSGIGTYTCAKIIPIIDALTNPDTGLLAECLCELVRLLDDLLVTFFEEMGGTWANCFCDPANGSLRTASNVANVILVSLMNFIRLFPLPCYWQPSGQSQTWIGQQQIPCVVGIGGCYCKWVELPMTQISQSWIYQFLGPLSNALCIALGNIMCFINSIFFISVECLADGQQFIGSTVRWGFELVFRIGSFIEGFVKQFTNPEPTCVGSNPLCNVKNTVGFKGVQPAPLAQLLTSLLSWPIDTALGDSNVACSRICPFGTYNNVASPGYICGCYQLSPQTDARNASGYSVWAPSSIVVGNNTFNACVLAYVPATGPVTTVLSMVGANGVSTGVGTFFPTCSAVGDFQPGAVSPFPFPYNGGWPGSCANYTLCRPDSLPSCGVNSGTPSTIYSNYQGPIDGIVMGLVRYISCAIGPSGGVVFKPLITILSFFWQLLGASIQLFVAYVLFLLSLFNLSQGCSCWDYSDPLQGGGLVRHIQGDGLEIGFCYACPDANAQCGIPPGGFLKCEPQCPFNFGPNSSAAIAKCVTVLGLTSNSALWPPGANATNLCDGSFGFGQWSSRCAYLVANPPALQQCLLDNAINWAASPYYQVNCHTPMCQFGQSGIVQSNYFSKVGSIEPASPLVLCFFTAIIDAVKNLVNAFISIISTPLITPSARRGEPTATTTTTSSGPHGPVTREYVADFWRRSGVYLGADPADEEAFDFRNISHGLDRESRVRRLQQIGRVPKLPHTTDDAIRSSSVVLIARALWDYDTSDCFNDTVSCVCRNMYMPQFCHWDPINGTISNPRRSTRGLFPEGRLPPVQGQYNQHNTINDHEIRHILCGRFHNATSCDHTVHSTAKMIHVGDGAKEALVQCIDKRIQGERVSRLTNGIVPEHIFYHSQAPLELLQNMITGLHANVKRDEAKRQRNTHNYLEREFPGLEERLEQRQKDGYKYLQEKLSISPCNPIAGAIVQADTMHQKYESGYYGSLMRHFDAAVRSGNLLWPSTEETARDLQLAFNNFVATVRNQPYLEFASDTVGAVDHVARGVQSLLETGLVQGVRNARDAITDHFKRKRELATSQRKRIDWAAMPIVAWWKHMGKQRTTMTTVNGTTISLFRHIRETLAYRRQNADDDDDDEQPTAPISRSIKHWTTPVWTDNKIEHWKRAARIGYRVYDTVWPGVLDHKRIVWDSNCLIVELLVNVTTKVVNFCVDYQANINYTRSARHYRLGAVPKDPNARTPVRHPAWLPQQQQQQQEQEPLDFVVSLFASGGLSDEEKVRAVIRKQVDRRVRKRALPPINPGPGGWNFYAWFVEVFTNILDITFDMNSNTLLNEIRAWLQNRNTNESDYPDVGLSYWLLFPTRCIWPENLDCSQGFGLETAFVWVTVGVVGVMLVGAFAFPPAVWPFMFISAFIWWLILMGAIGFHFSPRCAFLFPSLTGVGIALPMCLADSIINITDKYITNCYSPLIIPECLISGDACPADPNTYIDFVSCSLVGVSDGIQNALFLLYQLIGEPFYDFALFITSATIGNIIPGLNDYMKATMNNFKGATGCQLQRQWVCFGLTGPAIVLPLLLFSLIFVGVGFVIPLLIIVLIQLFNTVITSPLYDDSAWSDEALPVATQKNEEEEEENPEQEPDPNWVQNLRQDQAVATSK